jgi:GNAT superfamily N-acetyltransferase
LDIDVRTARPEDLAFLVEGNARMAEETEARTLDRALLEAGVAAALADPAKGTYFIAEHAGRAVGQLLRTYEWSDWRNGLYWWIQSVYVVQDARGRGVFAALYRHLDSLARREPSVCGIRLYVERDNRTAAAIYAHLGLADTGYRVLESVFRARGRAPPEI